MTPGRRASPCAERGCAGGSVSLFAPAGVLPSGDRESRRPLPLPRGRSGLPRPEVETMKFDKSRELFPIKNKYIFLSHCGISPLYSEAFSRMCEVAKVQVEGASMVFSEYDSMLNSLRNGVADLMKTSGDNIAFVKNTSEGINLIANGYPFENGDEIISYVHEYPANHYPWRLQENRGVKLVLLEDHDPTEVARRSCPSAWSFEELERLTTSKTRVLAISHVQFASGFAADLPRVASFCNDRGIDLVVDAAQSLGAMPLYPEDLNLAAVVSAGWKWLMGPLGTGLMYTSPALRAKLEHVVVGAETMLQGTDYLDHTWAPHSAAKRFEYSTSPLPLAAALDTCIRGVQLHYGIEAVHGEIMRLHDLFLKQIDHDRYTPLLFPSQNRSTILSLNCGDHDAREICSQLPENGLICTSRGEYLRFAPHVHNTDEEVARAAEILNAI